MKKNFLENLPILQGKAEVIKKSVKFHNEMQQHKPKKEQAMRSVKEELMANQPQFYKNAINRLPDNLYIAYKLMKVRQGRKYSRATRDFISFLVENNLDVFFNYKEHKKGFVFDTDKQDFVKNER